MPIIYLEKLLSWVFCTTLIISGLITACKGQTTDFLSRKFDSESTRGPKFVAYMQYYYMERVHIITY